MCHHASTVSACEASQRRCIARALPPLHGPHHQPQHHWPFPARCTLRTPHGGSSSRRRGRAMPLRARYHHPGARAVAPSQPARRCNWQHRNVAASVLPSLLHGGAHHQPAPLPPDASSAPPQGAQAAREPDQPAPTAARVPQHAHLTQHPGARAAGAPPDPVPPAHRTRSGHACRGGGAREGDVTLLLVAVVL